MPETNPATQAKETAVKEQLAKHTEARKKSTEEYAKRMENAKPTPSQEENDLARLGDDVLEKADDGSGPEPKITLTASHRRGRRKNQRGQACSEHLPDQADHRHETVEWLKL